MLTTGNDFDVGIRIRGTRVTITRKTSGNKKIITSKAGPKDFRFGVDTWFSINASRFQFLLVEVTNRLCCFREFLTDRILDVIQKVSLTRQTEENKMCDITVCSVNQNIFIFPIKKHLF